MICCFIWRSFSSGIMKYYISGTIWKIAIFWNSRYIYFRNIAVLIFLVTLRWGNFLPKIFVPFIHDLTKTQCVFYLIKHVYWNWSQLFPLELLKNGHTVYISFKNNFILNLGNKINWFLTQANCHVRHVL